MAAPNGARKTKDDHPALPMSVIETVETAKACHEAGATGLHALVRNDAGMHVLDAGLYKTLLSELSRTVPEMQVQITTEAVGIYGPHEQRDLVHKVRPKAVSIALREMIPDDDVVAAGEFYTWALGEKIAIQHILYTPQDLEHFFAFTASGVIPGTHHQLLFVLGRYATDLESTPEDLEPFLETMAPAQGGLVLDWAICAFGHRETECLVRAIQMGGKARIGFENGIWNRHGDLATDNADRVRDLIQALKEQGLYPSED
ncbi:MAG: 3-keto-5-aminohexanoate cleavage protein [Roseibium sp.]|nr:3-keto-5-aminohexanoate cleavage protein [Roseibium sp.]